MSQIHIGAHTTLVCLMVIFQGEINSEFLQCFDAGGWVTRTVSGL